MSIENRTRPRNSPAGSRIAACAIPHFNASRFERFKPERDPGAYRGCMQGHHRLWAAVALSVCGCSTRPADSVAGRWTGAFTVGASRQEVIVDVAPAGSEYTAIIEIPAQVRTDSSARFRVTDTLVVLTGGTGPERLNLVGRRTGDSLILRPPAALNLPEPVPGIRLGYRGPVPAPAIHIRAAEFDARDGRRSGWGVFPARSGPHPGVALIHGSGRGTRNDLLGYAARLARGGIAAVVYDKREPTTGSGDDITAATDLADDAIAAATWLAAQREVDPARIGVWGNSQGGGVAAIAAGRSPLFKFVVSVSGGATSYTSFVVFQGENRMRNGGLSPALVAQGTRLIRLRHDYLRGEVDSAMLAREIARADRRLADFRVRLNVPDRTERASWERSGLLRGDGTSAWRGVRVPVLAIWGGADELVPAMESARNVQDALGPAIASRSTVCLVADADHGMRLPAGPGRGPNGEFAFATLAPAFRDGVVTWIREVTGLEPAGTASRALATMNCIRPPR